MSDLRSRAIKYKEYIDAGVSEDAALSRAGITREEVIAVDGATPADGIDEISGYAEAVATMRASMGMETSLEELEEASRKLYEVTTTPDNYARDHILQGGEPGDGPWIIRALTNVGGTFAMPQAALFHWMKGEDIRKAVPPFLSKKEWMENPDTSFEFVTFLDAAGTFLSGMDDSTSRAYGRDLLNISEKSFFEAADIVEQEGDKAGANILRGGSMFINMFVDTATDPLTYLTSMGIGQAAFKQMRRVVPFITKTNGKFIEADALVRIAQHTKDVSDLDAARKALQVLQDDVVEQFKKGNIDSEQAWGQFKEVSRVQGSIQDELDLRLLVKDGEIAAEGVPHARPENVRIPEEKGLARDLALQRKKALDEGWVQSVRPEDMEYDALMRHMATGPDAATVSAEQAGRVAAGALAEDVPIHTRVPINPVESSLNIRRNGVGRDGRILETRRLIDHVVSGLEKRQDSIVETINNLKKAGDMPDGPVTQKGLDALFDDMAGVQRGRPEDAMLSWTAALGGGVRGVVAEHLGDLTHRMGEAVTAHNRGYDFMKDKVNKVYDLLTHEYGHAKEAAENALSNYSFRAKRGEWKSYPLEKKPTSVREYAKDIEMLGNKYAAEHAQVPVYNEVQRMARDAAVAYGKGDFETATTLVEKLKVHIDQGPDHWLRVANEYDPVIAATNQPIYKARGKTAAKEIAGHEKEIKRISKAINFTRKNGKLPKEYVGKELIYPSGARRDFLDSSKFATSQFGEAAGQFFRAALYPKSIMIRPTAAMRFDVAMRETYRVLEKYAPPVAKRVFGGLRDAETELSRRTPFLMERFQRAGVISRRTGPAGEAIGLNNFVEGLSIDKAKSELMYSLLNTKKGSEAWEALAATADENMLNAVDDIRWLLNRDSTRLGLNPDEHIEGYIRHMLDQDHFKGSSKPFIYDGMPLKQNVPSILKTRNGDQVAITPDIVSVMDYYNRALAHELYVRPMYQDIRLGIKDALRASGNPKELNYLNQYGEHLISSLEGRPSFARQLLDKLGLPPAMTNGIQNSAIVMALTAFNSTLAGSLRYWTMSVAQSINSAMPKYGVMNTLRGLAAMSSTEGRKLARIAGTAGETERMMEGMISKISSIATDLRVGAPSMRDAESFIRGVTFTSSMGEQLQKLGVEAITQVSPNMAVEITAKAMQDSRRMNHVFGFLGKPFWFNKVSRSGSTFATMFTSFPFKQTETIIGNALENPGYIADYLMTAGFLSKMADHFAVDLDKYVGVGYTEDFPRTLQGSIPVKTSLAFVRWAETLNPNMDVREAQRRHDAFLREAKNLIPYYTATQRWKDVSKTFMGEPVTKETTGEQKSLVRTKNTSLKTVDGVRTEFFSTLLHMTSFEDKLQRFEKERVRTLSNEIDRNLMAISDMFYEKAKEGKVIDRDKLVYLVKNLRDLGHDIDLDDLSKMATNEYMAAELPQVVRDAIRDKNIASAHKTLNTILRKE